ncbi:disease resistance protein RGA2-like [Solanum stenotomum]|uniref:disease resistance protein RGA2-like n=1 Tax=Solanum stenotomum TaxID=172797 RepID=UPI0020D15BEC|nr:disease resistance protein RGA2-like [Solanum stenotomum]
MADPVIGATLQVVLEKLLSLTIEELKSLRNFNNDLEMLIQNVSLIQAFIHDVERPQVEKQVVEQWLMRLERVAENAENVFDQLRYESLKTKVMKIRNSPVKKVRNFFSHTSFKCKMSRKINNVTQELMAINKDKDASDIKEKILNMREDVVLCTIPIVGMGGLGKTTVAKRIFNDEQIEKHFEKRVWLCLPEMSEMKSFLEPILESLTERKLEVQSRDIIVKKLRDELTGRKYLLVLDDLWRVDPTLWHEFVDTLRGINTSRGNCILVTTRMELVASAVAVGPHMLEKLTEHHCWSIFKQKAFVDGEVPEEIMIMEKRIGEMCQGLPLAASVLGGLLRNKKNMNGRQFLMAIPLFHLIKMIMENIT